MTFFFFSSRRRHTRWPRDWSSDVCSSDLRVAAKMPLGSRGAFLATAQALDGDMEARIARHRADRPAGWSTLEEPFDVVAACGSLAGRVDVVVLDCLTLWVANLLLRGDEDKNILAAADALADFLAERRFSLIIV